CAGVSCADGERCNPTTGDCVPPPCAGDASCPQGDACISDAFEGVAWCAPCAAGLDRDADGTPDRCDRCPTDATDLCLLPPCAGDAGCPIGTFCGAAGRCAARPGGAACGACAADSDCGPDVTWRCTSMLDGRWCTAPCADDGTCPA